MVRGRAVLVVTVALVASVFGVVGSGGADGSEVDPAAGPSGAAAHLTLPAGFSASTAIGGLSEPVGAAFAPDGTAFVALKTGDIKSYDYDAAAGAFEPFATSTDFADLSVEVDNYGDRGLTGIAVDPQFPARPYVYVNYTYNRDPRDNPPVVPKWGTPGEQYDDCGPGEASISAPVKTGCPVMLRVSRLTAQRTATGWTMVAGSEKPLVTAGCFQFSSHSSGDVVFGPDGKLYASAGDGASYLGQDHGQADNACGDPADEGGSLRAQDVRGTGTADPLDVDGTIFRVDPDAGLVPSQATAAQWLVAYGQRNPWRLVFRPGTSELWSADVGSSNWEEINRQVAAPSSSLVNRGWPCYEGVAGHPEVNTAWDDLDLNLCESLYAHPEEVQPPVYAYRTRTGAAPLTPGEDCPVTSSALSGVAFAPSTGTYPPGYKGALFFSDFLRGCIWRLGTQANGDPDPSSVQVFAQGAGSPVKLLAGPGDDLFYLDYGTDATGTPIPGTGSLQRISYTAAAPVTVRSRFTVKSRGKLEVKVDGRTRKTPYAVDVAAGTVVTLRAPHRQGEHGHHYVFVKWKGVVGHARKAKQRVTVGTQPLSVKAVYRRQR